MISVCMATYNGARFIKEQIDSILPQLGADDELIVSDDGSTDGTLEIIASYDDERIKVLHHQKAESESVYRNFRYVTENFENALQHASGDCIFLSDQDDVWLPNKVARCMELLETYGCVVHNYCKIDIDGKILEAQHFRKSPIHHSILMNILDNHFRGCCMAFKKELLQYALPISQKIIGHDYWLGTLAAYFMSVHYEMQPLVQSRQYAESVSAKRKTSIYYKLSFRLELLCAVGKRIQEAKYV